MNTAQENFFYKTFSAEFSDTIRHSSKITLTCTSCRWVAEEWFKPSYRIMNSGHSIGLGFAALEWLCYHKHEPLVQ